MRGGYSILSRHRIQKYPDLASTRFRIHSVFKNFHSRTFVESRFKKLRIRLPDSPDTCGRKPYLERESCGFKNIRIRVEGTLVSSTHVCLNASFLAANSFLFMIRLNQWRIQTFRIGVGGRGVGDWQWSRFSDKRELGLKIFWGPWGLGSV